MTYLRFLIMLRDEYSCIPGIENKGRKVSNSEIKRCIEQGGVRFNNDIVKINDEVEYPINSLIFFIKSKIKRCTIV